ncbi:MAG: aminomethyl-transferring glycine dehydrogenase subunit GcvPA [Spirochaetota bacterium]|nr:aminomethyl-transferring glycine dehydrogenase subunit GcvPA [Spirochaetota bacterium]
MSFLPNSDEDIRSMCNEIGVNSVEDLFVDIPSTVKNPDIQLPSPLSEQEAMHSLLRIANTNKRVCSLVGGGIYHHYVPAVVDHLSSRSEFYTAYTPYQPEVSQGTLAAIFEFQTYMCRLTGMDIANASMYDGATALAEAVLMAVRTTRKNNVLCSAAIHPHYRQVLATYAWASDISLQIVPYKNGATDYTELSHIINDTVACVVVQSPNFFGVIEDIEKVAHIAHEHKALCIATFTEAMSLGLLKSPGECGADIACGEGQSFGNYPANGGPLLGILACKKEFMRTIPGRLIGKTVDEDGRECYVMTLQTREQHIRRERATSNICTNEGLCALRATIYLGLVGNRLVELARTNHMAASYCLEQLVNLGYERVFDAPFFNEFVIKINNAKNVQNKLMDNGFALGIPLETYYPELSDCLLVTATECTTKDDIDTLVKLLQTI